MQADGNVLNPSLPAASCRLVTSRFSLRLAPDPPVPFQAIFLSLSSRLTHSLSRRRTITLRRCPADITTLAHCDTNINAVSHTQFEAVSLLSSSFFKLHLLSCCCHFSPLYTHLFATVYVLSTRSGDGEINVCVCVLVYELCLLEGIRKSRQCRCMSRAESCCQMPPRHRLFFSVRRQCPCLCLREGRAAAAAEECRLSSRLLHIFMCTRLSPLAAAVVVAVGSLRC